jgi:hypothetical protein
MEAEYLVLWNVIVFGYGRSEAVSDLRFYQNIQDEELAIL